MSIRSSMTSGGASASTAKSRSSLIPNFFRRPPMAPSSKNKQGTSQAVMNMSNKHVPRASSTLSTVRRGLRKQRPRGSRSRGGSIIKPRGTNSLFRAISAENWELVVELCEAKPYKAESWHSAPGFFDAHRSSTILPLHQACVFHPPKIALVRLIRAYPHGTMAKESGYGRVPLHIACHSSASMEAIRALLLQCPAASFEQDNLGRVPLHYALSNGSTTELVRELLISANEAGGKQGLLGCASAADFNGWMPLHVACHMCASVDTIRLLVQAYPDAIDKKTKKGSTPGALIKGLTIPEEKCLRMQAVLDGTEVDPPVDDLKRHPSDFRRSINDVRTIDGMASVTNGGTREVRLDLDGDASSLSSMDDTATIQTFNSRKADDNAEADDLLKSSADGPKNPNYLPTHRAYADDNSHANSHSKSIMSTPSEGYALGAGHVIVREQCLNRLGSIHNEIGLRNSTSSSNDDDDDDAVSHSFQSVTPTAVFC